MKKLGQKIFSKDRYMMHSVFRQVSWEKQKKSVLIDNYVDVGTLNILAKRKMV